MKHLHLCAFAVLLFAILVFSGCEDRGEPTPVELSKEQPKKQVGQPTGNSAAENASNRAIAPFDATLATVYQEASAKRGGVPVAITNSIGMKLILIPASEFLMGSTQDQQARFLKEAKARKEILPIEVVRREGPAHRVRITMPFYLGVYEVTQAEYEKVMGKNPSAIKGDSNPVEQVSWDEAAEFCKKLSATEGERYRLPTEAEWELACRAGTTTQYSFGDDPEKLGEYAWFSGKRDRKTHSVGKKAPNPWGLYDMHGNVTEWCADGADMGYYSVSPTDDPPRFRDQ